MATTTTSSRLREELMRRISVEREGSDTVSPDEPKESLSLFVNDSPSDVVPEGKVSYTSLVGESHPSGKEFYFTKYEVEDWPEEVRDLIPERDPHHVPDHAYILNLLMAIEFDKTVFAYGPPGSGKSVTPAQVCAMLNYPFMFIAGMGGTEPSDYVGSPWVKDGNMEWKDGPASFAVRNGVFMLYDEPFKASAQTNMCFQSLLDTRRTLKLYGHPDPVKGNLKAHPKFRMCLADNVRGFGDDMDKYAAEIQDQSTLNRCEYKLNVPYMPTAQEEEILKRKFPEASDKLVSCVVSLANCLRTAWEKGDIQAPYSIRDTQELVEAALFHLDVGVAFTQTYFGAVKDPNESKAIRDLFKTVFGRTATLA